MTNPEGPYVKVHFRLEIEDDRPPASVESLWAVDQGDGTARLDNIPWFVRGIACGDVVATAPDEEGVRWAGEVVRRSENCTIRLIVLRDGGSGAVRQSVINAFHERSPRRGHREVRHGRPGHPAHRRSRGGATAPQPRCGQGVVGHGRGVYHRAVAGHVRRLMPFRCPMASQPRSLTSY